MWYGGGRVGEGAGRKGRIKARGKVGGEERGGGVGRGLGV